MCRITIASAMLSRAFANPGAACAMPGAVPLCPLYLRDWRCAVAGASLALRWTRSKTGLSSEERARFTRGACQSFAWRSNPAQGGFCAFGGFTRKLSWRGECSSGAADNRAMTAADRWFRSSRST